MVLSDIDPMADWEDPLIAEPAQIISDDKDSNDEGDLQDVARQAAHPEGAEPEGATTTPNPEGDSNLWCQTLGTSFDTDGPSNPLTPKPAIVEEEEDTQPKNKAAELLRYHHQFGHISFRKLQLIIKMGVLPRRLQNFPVPVCSAYLYAKAIKEQWRYQTVKNREVPNNPTKPGHLVSVDQLVSPTPGLIAQMTGILTTKRYKYATVYVDQVVKLSFTYLQKTATAEETSEGKEAFERYALDRGVTNQAYHADNGIFRANKWVADCVRKGQPLTFAGVNAHHQNGLAERRIREIQELARTMLIHAAIRWPKCVTINLWPYAIRMANNNRTLV